VARTPVPAPVALGECLVPTGRVLTTRAKEEVILLHLDDGSYYSLDEIGSRIWALCDGTRTLADVAAVICEEYEAPQATIEADATEFAGELVAAGLLVRASV
jgi:hypothetical protein